MQELLATVHIDPGFGILGILSFSDEICDP